MSLANHGALGITGARQRLDVDSTGLFRDASDFVGEQLRHPGVAQAVCESFALFKNFDRARYVALTEKDPGLAEHSRIPLAFFGLIHEDRNRE